MSETGSDSIARAASRIARGSVQGAAGSAAGLGAAAPSPAQRMRNRMAFFMAVHSTETPPSSSAWRKESTISSARASCSGAFSMRRTPRASDQASEEP